ncbi:MAG TPA: hypothetical protein VIN07_07920 [Flavipsychrobacter sp.]
MKRTTWVILFSAMLLACFVNDADAQSRRERRRLKRLEEQRKERAEQQHRDVIRKPAPAPRPKPPKKDFDYPESEMKNRYRIDLLASFYLPELVQDGKVAAKGKLPDKVIPSLKFYEGIVIAADTLKKLGYEFDIFVYDVADELESTATLVNTDAFKGSDLIIGNISSGDFALVANYAKKNDINFVSALSPSNQGVEQNPYFIMLQPTLETHCQTVEESIVRKNGNVKPLLFYRTNVQVDNTALASFITNGVLEYNKVPSDEMPSKEQIQPYLVKGRKNVALMPIISDKYAESIIRKLYEWFPEYDFEVWGMPSWDNMPALKRPEAFPNTVIYFTSPFYFDPTTASGMAVVNAYKRKYGAQPDNMVYRGYETMFWYAYLLKKYGNIFNHQLWDNGGAPFTRYEVKPVKGADDKLQYYENKHLYLYRYHSGSYMVEHQ